MGQRSQIYIRYKNGKNLVAMHLQWNYGHYMINRAYQLLDFINKNVNINYSNFKEESFDIANDGKSRRDIDILHNLIQENITIGSYVGGYDLIREDYEWYSKNNELKETFKMTPEKEDNNNGILVIDIQEDGTIKYGLAGGYEEIEGMAAGDAFKMISAREYFRLGENEYKLSVKNKELYDIVLMQIDFIDNNFKLLTDDEYKTIFDAEYEYKNCLKGID